MATITVMTPAQAAKGLAQLGWDGVPFARAVAGFQQGFALLGPALKVDADYGPLTNAALTLSLARHAAGKPNASKHFSFNEFRCRCTGTCAGEAHLPGGAAPTSRIWVRRDLLLALDKLRAAHYPHGLSPTSGCRCWAHHSALYKQMRRPVTTASAHLYGAGADIPAAVPLATVRGLRAFSGLGYQSSTAGWLVSHVDVRHRAGDMLRRNPSMSTPSLPATWPY